MFFNDLVPKGGFESTDQSLEAAALREALEEGPLFRCPPWLRISHIDPLHTLLTSLKPPTHHTFFFWLDGTLCCQLTQQPAYTGSSRARLRRYRRRLQFTTFMNWKSPIWKRIGWKVKNGKENGSTMPQHVLDFSGSLNFCKGWCFPPWVNARSFIRNPHTFLVRKDFASTIDDTLGEGFFSPSCTLVPPNFYRTVPPVELLPFAIGNVIEIS